MLIAHITQFIIVISVILILNNILNRYNSHIDPNNIIISIFSFNSLNIIIYNQHMIMKDKIIDKIIILVS